MTRSTQGWKVYQSVICNGHPGVITKLCNGQLAGMAEVRLARGSVCVDLDELQPEPITVVGVADYDLWLNGHYVRKATRVRFSDGTEVKFIEKVPKRLAIPQAWALHDRPSMQNADQLRKCMRAEVI